MRNLALIKNTVGGSIASTITIDADRKRYSSGIFLSQIYPSQGEHRPRSIDFAIRSIRGNKASNRTNNPSRSIAVVEAVSHPLNGDTSKLLTQLRTSTMKTITKPTALLGAVYPIAAFLSQCKFTFCLASVEVSNER